MMTRLLYGIVVIMAVLVCWEAWGYQRTWSYLEYGTPQQSYGADPAKAKVTILAFMDYASRPSKQINATVMEIIARQPDTRIVFHLLPGASLMARENAKLAVAAGMQGQFIAMHEELMRNEEPLIKERIREIAERLKIDPDRLMSDAAGTVVEEALKNEEWGREHAGVRQSPLFIIERRWLYGPSSYEAVSRELTSLIEKARKL